MLACKCLRIPSLFVMFPSDSKLVLPGRQGPRIESRSYCERSHKQSKTRVELSADGIPYSVQRQSGQSIYNDSFTEQLRKLQRSVTPNLPDLPLASARSLHRRTVKSYRCVRILHTMPIHDDLSVDTDDNAAPLLCRVGQDPRPRRLVVFPL